MLENGVFNRPYVRDITKICECACSMNCDKNATELRPDRNPDIITNADRIRAMSDEELSDIFLRADFCKYCEHEKDGVCNYICAYPNIPLYDGCKQAALTWLQQLYEGE